MAQYCFVDKEGKAASLDSVDRQICEKFGVPYSETDYCMFYNFMVDLGFGILISQGGSRIDVPMMDKYCKYKREKMSGKDEQEITEFFDFVDQVQPFLDGTIYQFEGWR